MMQLFHQNPDRIISNARWKVAGAFIKPNGIFLYPICAGVASKSSLVPVFFPNGYLPKSTITIERREDIRAVQRIDAVIHARQRIRVTKSSAIQLTVVDAESPLPGLFWFGQNDYRSCPLRHRWFNDLLL